MVVFFLTALTSSSFFFFFNDTATTEIYTLSLHDALPTYRRPDVPYHAASIAGGKALFAQHCAACHGPRGGGDGPAAAALNPKPPDLRAHHVSLHTAGDLFWWIGDGLRTMPAFADRLSPDE